jgi:hypothetical protein
MSGGVLARVEAGEMGDNEQLRELHDTYVWEVNAAVGEGRLDLVWQLADDYLDQALELITGAEQAGCERPDCAVCQGPRPAPAVSRRHRWSRRRRGTAAG